MSTKTQWLDQSLDGVEPAQADRVRVFRMLMLEGARLRGLLDRALAPSGQPKLEVALRFPKPLPDAQALLAGEPTQDAKDRELTAKTQFDDWYKTHGCA